MWKSLCFGRVGILDAEDIQARIEGSGRINMVGSAEDLRATIAGSGDIKADGFAADRASVSIYGSGSCTLRVDDSLDARIYGSGSIYYYGSPSISSVDAGSGRLIPLSF